MHHTSTKSTVRPRRFLGRAIAGAFVLFGMTCCAGIAWLAIKDVVGEFAGVAVGAFILAITLASHAITTWWAWHIRPHWSRWLISQTPYVLMYGMLYVWYSVPWSVEDGAPSLWYLPWAGIATATLSWLWIWWLDWADRRNPRQAIVFMTLLIVMIGGNGAAGAAVVWKRTDGLGLVGAQTSAEAVDAFLANSCLFGQDMYRRGGKLVFAECPQDLGNAPSEELDTYLASDQPKQPLQRWYQTRHVFRYLPHLKHGDWTVREGNGSASAELAITLPLRSDGQDLSGLSPAELWCIPNGRNESWTVRLEPTTAGGWKVARVDVGQTVTVVPYVGSVCERR